LNFLFDIEFPVQVEFLARHSTVPIQGMIAGIKSIEWLFSRSNASLLPTSRVIVVIGQETFETQTNGGSRGKIFC
jgi:hypothetical protein